jgi:hypothetical protein
MKANDMPLAAKHLFRGMKDDFSVHLLKTLLALGRARGATSLFTYTIIFID